MIEAIKISNVATFCETPDRNAPFSLINFIYGPNGSGKTTLSKIIAQEDKYPTCELFWETGVRPIPIVYNREFIENNFDQPSDLKGIFTLGEDAIEVKKEITQLKLEIDQLNNKIKTYEVTIKGEGGNQGKQYQLDQHEDEFKRKCWEQKKKHDVKLAGAFKGYRDSKESFKDKILNEIANNEASLESLEKLYETAKTVYGPTPSVENSLKLYDTQKLFQYESYPILSKIIIGKNDVDISDMISRLKNSDWVREGRSFFEINNGKCPFCQQATTQSFSASLAEYFDETFEKDTNALKQLQVDYQREINNIKSWLEPIISSQSKFVDSIRLEAEKAAFDSTCSLNLQNISRKIKEPSRIVVLNETTTMAANIKDIIENANKKIASHNEVAENIVSKRLMLTSQIWKYLVKVELKNDIDLYQAEKSALETAINSIKGKISSLIKERKQKEASLIALEKKTTSIQPTVNNINRILTSFGFSGFSLAITDCGTCYKLIRADGTNAKDTLSEGEKSFIIFLYFYCLINGSASSGGITTDRIVVFDDPVSSLDSEVLFIVSSLIQKLLKDVISNVGHIKQIFILTHNVYFYKEVTFNPARSKDGTALKEETFWVVRKVGTASKLDKCPSRPITTSYELLWDEIRKKNRSIHSIRNTMRRVLEYYFQIMGGIKFDSLWDKFEGNDKLICRSLFSWIHDGSHFSDDDLYMAIDESMVEKYCEVFRGIFEKTNHIEHYNMMMKI